MVEKNKIILITHEYPPQRGGAGVYCEELGFATSQLPIDLEVWAPRYSNTNEEFNIRMLPYTGSQDWSCSWSLFQYIKRNIPQAKYLHIADPGSLRAMIRFGWLLSNLPPLIITIHGSELLRFTRFAAEKFLFRRLLERAKKIHVLSRHNEERLKEFYPEVSGNIQRLPGAPARRVLPDDQTSKNKNSKLSRDKITLLCVGRIHPRKGQLELVQAISQLSADTQRKLICRIAGPMIKKSYFEKLKMLAEQTVCKIEFLGDLSDSDLKKEYESSDLFALTSIPQKKSIEGFGFVYLEASAHGLPVIANRTGGVEDAVLDGETGFLVDLKNTAELSEKIELLIGDSQLREKMGQKGIEWAAKHSWTELATRLYEDPS